MRSERSRVRGGPKTRATKRGPPNFIIFLKLAIYLKYEVRKVKGSGGGPPPLRPPAARVQAERSCTQTTAKIRTSMTSPLFILDVFVRILLGVSYLRP